MDKTRARALLEAERTRVESLLRDTVEGAEEDRDAANQQPADSADPATDLTAELGNDAITVQLRERLVAIARAERRLEEGTYGLSIRSGEPIPDDRLEADPAAELTAPEARGG